MTQLGIWPFSSTEDSLDPNKMSDAKLKEYARKGLKPYHETLVQYGQQMSFQEMLDYFDKLQPSFQKFFGKAIVYASKSLSWSKIYEQLRQIAHISKGGLPNNAKALTVYYDMLSNKILDPDLDVVGQWFVKSVKQTANQAVGKALSITGAAIQPIKYLLFGVVGVAGLYFLTKAASLGVAYKKLRR